MRNVIGFAIQEEEHTPEAEMLETILPAEEPPTRCLARIWFPETDEMVLYYNNAFALKEGDCVYVSGERAGKVGGVHEIITKYKIQPSKFDVVTAKFNPVFHGTYLRTMDKMVCFDGKAPAPAQFRTWVMPPTGSEEEFEYGEGYRFELSQLEEYSEISKETVSKALGFCSNHHVLYISLADGIGTAFIRDNTIYEIQFRYKGGLIYDLFCDCPSGELCPHALALMITLRSLLMSQPRTEDEDFVAVDAEYFWKQVTNESEAISL